MSTNNGQSRNAFSLQFSNICGLKSNLISVFAHLQLFGPDILALSETQVFNNLDITQFNCPGYSFIPVFFPHRGIALYIKNTLSFSRLKIYESRICAKFSFIWIKFQINDFETYFCFLYRSPELSSDNTATELDHLSHTIDNIYSKSPHAEIIIAGDFNVHNSQWLPHSHQTDLSGQYTEIFSLLNGMSQLVDQPTYIPRQTNQQNSLLDLFLTTHPFRYTTTVSSPI